MGNPSHTDRPRRLVFGEVAGLYDRARPSYPASLIDDLVSWAQPGGRALEIGAGTGKATRLLAARGVSVLGIEPSAEMAVYAASGEPMTMAGAFSIEGLGAPFIDGINGDPSNVLGLSLSLLRRMLAEMDVMITDLWRKTPDLQV